MVRRVFGPEAEYRVVCVDISVNLAGLCCIATTNKQERGAAQKGVREENLRRCKLQTGETTSCERTAAAARPRPRPTRTTTATKKKNAQHIRRTPPYITPLIINTAAAAAAAAAGKVSHLY